ncbi:tetratricopeptide repeat protein [Klebsiella michiganensis]|uniref:tetratricopeptide repeat protein n=1 Tax=Klebsiella michiganensis TaxID=1134687 RepID=UPI00256FEEA3|nr:tetratricopeptide repeat protein [Klebsiella michiganensis]MDL4454975.1 tetratricopeptide repeat protein [Klebsiella michiganensis]
MQSFQCPPLFNGQITRATEAEHSPQTAEMQRLYARSYQDYSAGELNSAQHGFLQLAMQSPTRPEFLFALACTLKRQQNYADALDLFNYVQLLQPENPWVNWQCAVCAQELNNGELAWQQLKNTIELCFSQASECPDYDSLRQRAEQQCTLQRG